MKPKAQPRQWYRFSNSSSDHSVAELTIYDDIGRSYWNDDAVSAKSFNDDLKRLAQSVTKIICRVNSLGGDVFEAVAIANALREQSTSKGRTVETVVDGIAASAASIVIMAGSVIRVADNAIVMIHNPWTLAIGNSAEMRKTADALDAVRASILATYKWHSQLTDDELVALMDAETWMDADMAIANGFATEKVEGLKAAALLEPRALAKLTVPEKYRARVESFVKPTDPAPTTPHAAVATEVLRLCREGACLDVAEALITDQATLEEVQARIATVAEERTAATARATEITAACTTARLPELAADYIAGTMPLDRVKAQLVTLRAKLDQTAIDTGLAPGDGKPRRRAAAGPNAMFVESTH
jgi:ATP-dependent protease ClpP protease subunit